MANTNNSAAATVGPSKDPVEQIRLVILYVEIELTRIDHGVYI
jgi:hypothetical protein